MWVEKVALENIKCFEKLELSFASKGEPFKWVTLLSENGSGKSTILQALGLLLAGPESAQKLLPRPDGWLREAERRGLVSARIHQGPNDPGHFGDTTRFNAFGYSFYVTGDRPITINQKRYNEPAVVEGPSRQLSWLRQNAFTPEGQGWFAAGYGPFRRLTRVDRIYVPALDQPARFTNFQTQFDENEPLSTFEQWTVYLDWRIAKGTDAQVHKRHQDMTVGALNSLLPNGTRYSRVSPEGRVLFTRGSAEVPTTALSDGYRSVIALAGDLVWRMISAFPDSNDPMQSSCSMSSTSISTPHGNAPSQAYSVSVSPTSSSSWRLTARSLRPVRERTHSRCGWSRQRACRRCAP